MMQPIPPMLDFDMILGDLKSCGWSDQKLEIACGLGNGYVSLIRKGKIEKISLLYAARLHNLWVSEVTERALTQVATTS